MGVYRLVITLACESSLTGWFVGDSVGNSGCVTSFTTARAAGQLPRRKPYFTHFMYFKHFPRPLAA